MKLWHSLTLYTKTNSKWIKDLNVRLDSIKSLEENISKALFEINCSKISFDTLSRVMTIKTKTNTLDLIKLKSFCIAKEIIYKTKDNSQDEVKYLQTSNWQGIKLQNIQIDIATMENNMDVSLKTNNRATIWPSNSTPRHINQRKS